MRSYLQDTTSEDEAVKTTELQPKPRVSYYQDDSDTEDRMVKLTDRVLRLDCGETPECKEELGNLGCTLTSSVAICKIEAGPVPQTDRAHGGVSRRVFNLRAGHNLTVRAGRRVAVDTGLKLSIRPSYGILVLGTRRQEARGLLL